MALTASVVLAVLFAALLHAGWNAWIKSGADKELDTALVHSLGVIVALPMLCFTGMPDRASWPFVGASTAIHLGYYAALAGAYRHGDLGLTYPLMRGCAPLLVAVGTVAFVGDRLSGWAWAGVGTICAGVLMLGLAPGRSASSASTRRGKAILFALGNAFVIAAYTVVDGIGVRLSNQALAYVAALFLLDGVPYLLLVLWRRPGRRLDALRHMKSRWPIALMATGASLGSYGIALWAMTRAPVAAVAALRETSVLFAVVIGAVWLQEPFGWQRGSGTLVLVLGVVLLRSG
ncbi:MAG: phosphonate utilization protein [Comamonadaceae bacterium]|nr:MAG: phosphonate utilization protein [Comamonadaceae bacterium]